MITEVIFKEQLLEVFQSRLFQSKECVECLIYDEELGILRFFVSENRTCQVEFCITYSSLYREPQLLYRKWSAGADGARKLDFSEPKVLRNHYFPCPIGVDTFGKDQSVWFFVHACDTECQVGSSYPQKYLRRWISLYLGAIFRRDIGDPENESVNESNNSCFIESLNGSSID